MCNYLFNFLIKMKLLKNKAVIIVVIIIGGLIILNTFFKDNQKVIVDKPLKHVSASEVYNCAEDIQKNMLSQSLIDLDRALKEFSNVDIALCNCGTVHETAWKILDTAKFVSDTMILSHFDDYKKSVAYTRHLSGAMLLCYVKKDFKCLNEHRSMLALNVFYQEDILDAMKRRIKYLSDPITPISGKN